MLWFVRYYVERGFYVDAHLIHCIQNDLLLLTTLLIWGFLFFLISYQVFIELKQTKKPTIEIRIIILV